MRDRRVAMDAVDGSSDSRHVNTLAASESIAVRKRGCGGASVVEGSVSFRA
jgi:hypothetical protein